VLLTEDSQQKLKELRDSHNWCCITIRSDYCYVWDVYLTRGYRPGIREDDHKPCVISGSWEDLNDAVNEVYKKAQKFLENESANGS
jgi:hypothetical protein